MAGNLHALIEEAVAKHPWGAQPKSLYEPIQYIMALRGKRLRPQLTLLSYSIFKPDIEKVIPYAIAVEVFHNFTLMHDDIMDGAPLRRGKKTVHEKWNVSTGILSGDVMLVKVYDLFLGLEEKKFKKVISLFNACATAVCEGQQLDMEFESRKKVSEHDYVFMIRLKTAVLLGFCLELGATLAEAPEKDRAILRDAGIHLGIGFQLMDDVLDVFGDKKQFGKQIGGDIIANKKTFLLIKALEIARGKDKVELSKWLTVKRFDKGKKVKAIRTLYEKLGIRKLAERKAAEFFDSGLQGLENLKNSQELLRFVLQLAARTR